MDTYDKTARLAPAYITLFPLLLLIVALFSSADWWEQVVALIVAAGIPILLSDIVRYLGKSNQSKMFNNWGGVPTTQFLRHHPSDKNSTEDNPILRAERHKHIERVTGLTMPTADEEASDERAALHKYDAAVSLIRPFGNQNALVSRENAHYGFWRNLFALRPWVVTVGIVGIITSAVLFLIDVKDWYDTSKPWLIVDALISILWLTIAWKVITEEAVKRAGNNYARELLQTLPTLPSKDANGATGTVSP